MNLTILIPFKDEKSRLPQSLVKLERYLNTKMADFEVILVDDGSTDGTVDAIKDFLNRPYVKLLKHKDNLGKGCAVKTGVMNASGKYILISDADFSTPIEEYEKLHDYMYRGFQIAIGSRALKTSKIIKKQRFFRRIIGRFGNLLARIILGLKYKDTQCGFKLFRGDVAVELFKNLKTTGWAFDFEILKMAQKKGFKIQEIGVVWENNEFSHIRLFKDSFKSLVDLFKIRFIK